MLIKRAQDAGLGFCLLLVQMCAKRVNLIEAVNGNGKTVKRKDGTHLLFVGLIATTLTISFIIFVNMNNHAAHEARVSEYSSALSGRGLIDVAPDRGFIIPLVLITLAVIGGLAAWWAYEIRAIDSFNAKTPDSDLLDETFRPGQDIVTYQVTRGSMSHATVVMGARERGYVLTSQGQDGSLVFEPGAVETDYLEDKARNSRE